MARFAGTALTDYFSTPDFTQVGKVGMEGQSLQRNSATKAEGLVHGAGINSMAEVASAGFQAEATKAAGQAQGQASMMSGLASGIGSIAGGFGSMGSSGGASSYGGYGSTGINTPGKYGSFDKSSVQRAHNNFTPTPGLG